MSKLAIPKNVHIFQIWKPNWMYSAQLPYFHYYWNIYIY